MIKEIRIGILFSSRIGDRACGKALLELLEPRYSPKKCNDHEPIGLPYSRSRIEEALQLWGWGFLWRRGKPRMRGSVWTSSDENHDVIYLSMANTAFHLPSVLALFDQIHDLFGIDFAYIHARTDKDSKDLEHYRRHIMPFSQALSTRTLRRGLPDLPWGTFFPPYQELFGSRLEKISAHSVRALRGATYIQLTEDIRDMDRNREKVESTRSLAKKLLNSNAFVNSDDQECRVPEFFLDVN